MTNANHLMLNISSQHSSIKLVAILQEWTFFLIWLLQLRNLGFHKFVDLTPCFLQISYICNIWCRASDILTHVMLSSSSIWNQIWFTSNKIITWVKFFLPSFTAYLLYESPRSEVWTSSISSKYGTIWEDFMERWWVIN